MHKEMFDSTSNKRNLGFFNYLHQSTSTSLYRNGKVGTNRDSDGNDYRTFGLTLSKTPLEICNARNLSGTNVPSCEYNGFQLEKSKLGDLDFDFLDQEQIVQDYYKHCANIVMHNTGGRAYAFDHNIRSASGKQANTRILGGQQVQEPLHLVHGDYTLRSAPQRLHDLSLPPTGNDTLASILPAGESLIKAADAQHALSNGRFSIINVWRNIRKTPVMVRPLALCDARSVTPEDLVVFEIHYQDRIGENYFAKHSKHQRWFYYPQMTRDEVLLIKQWDSDGTFAKSRGELADGSSQLAPCTFSFHSAFDETTGSSDAPDRWSVEVRCIVIYD